MVKGIKVSSWIDGMDDSIAVGTYNSNSPVSKLVEDVRHSIAEYLLQQPKSHIKLIDLLLLCLLICSIIYYPIL